MAEIKSAFEIAMARAEKIGKLSEKEIENQKWSEHGQKKAADFLAGRGDDLRKMISDVPGDYLNEAIGGITDTLLRNIVLPREPEQWDSIRKALKGMEDIKGSAASRVLPGIVDLLKQYEQTRDQYLEQFKAQMENALQSYQSSAGMGGPDMGVVAKMQQEWDRISVELNQQFEQQLAPMKEYLKQI